MQKKKNFLLLIIIFCIKIIGSEQQLQLFKSDDKRPKQWNENIKKINNKQWLNALPKEILYKITHYCSLTDIVNFKQTCKQTNQYDTSQLICPTHSEKNHQCFSSILFDLKSDYDLCTYILHYLANKKNPKNSYEFNNPSEKNLFSLIYSLHSDERNKEIQNIHTNLAIELFFPEIKRNHYKYTKENSYNLLLKAIEHKKEIRIKQILQNPNQCIKQIFTIKKGILKQQYLDMLSNKNMLLQPYLDNLINNVLQHYDDSKNIIEILLAPNVNISEIDLHNLWEEIILKIYATKIKHKDEMIKFLLSDKFDYLDTSFSSIFYTGYFYYKMKNGFLFFCDNEADFDLITNRYDNNTIFEDKNIFLKQIPNQENFDFSIKKIEWLIKKNINFNKINAYYCGIEKAYKIGNIELVKLLIKQNANCYYKFFEKICKKNDIKMIEWIINNQPNMYKHDDSPYTMHTIYQACKAQSIEIIKFLFDKKIPIDFYKQYPTSQKGRSCAPELLFTPLTYGQKDIKKVSEIISLFIQNNLDINQKCFDDETYKNKIEKNQELKKLLLDSNSTNNPTDKTAITTDNNLEQPTQNPTSETTKIVNDFKMVITDIVRIAHDPVVIITKIAASLITFIVLWTLTELFFIKKGFALFNIDPY